MRNEEKAKEGPHPRKATESSYLKVMEEKSQHGMFRT